MRCHADGKNYYINQDNTCKLNDKLKGYLDFCMEDDKATSRPYSHRYIGSMVADLHRNLIKGGIFMYPEDRSNPKGKLRLLYECNPMSHIIEMAGGKGTAGSDNILDIQPTELHQRVPIYIGSKNMVEKAVGMIY